MNSPHDTKGQAAVKTVDFSGYFGAEEDQGLSLSHLAKKKVLIHRDSVKVLQIALSSSIFSEFNPQLLFPNLKKCLDGKRFDPNDKIINQKNAYFKDLV